MDYHVRTFLFFSLLIVVAEVEAVSKEASKLLLKKFRPYGSVATPVISPNDTTRVDFGVAPLHIELNEHKQNLIVNAFLVFVWEDEHMSWEPSEYGGLKYIRLPQYLVWTPDITVYNGLVEGVIINPRRHAAVVVHHTGITVWVPTAKLTTYCNLDHTNYPYDHQECPLIFGSWTYSMDELELKALYNTPNYSSLVQFDYYQDRNPMWVLTNYTEYERIKVFGKDKYQDVTVTLKLSRRYSLYQPTLVTPIALAALLALLMFWLPPWHEKRLTTALLAVLILVIVLIHLAWKLPPTVNVPKIVRLCRTTLIAVCVSIVTTVAVLNLSRGPFLCIDRPPDFLVNILQGIVGKLMCLHGSVSGPTSHSAYKRATTDGDGMNDDKVYLSDEIQVHPSSNDWKIVALALDRVLFVVFAVTFLVTTLS